MTKPVDWEGFGRALFCKWPMVCDLDTSTVIEIGQAHGVVTVEWVMAPCGDDCNCADSGYGFPTTCYRVVK